MAIICLIPTRNVGWVTNFFPINSCILWCLSGGLGLSLNLGLSLIRTGLDSMPSRNINQPDRWRTFPFDSAFSWLQQTITPDFTSICILISQSFFFMIHEQDLLLLRQKRRRCLPQPGEGTLLFYSSSPWYQPQPHDHRPICRICK